MYCSDNYFSEKMDDCDRQEMLPSKDLKDDLINDLIIINRGLINKWSDVLRGEKDWMQSLKTSEWYSIRRPNKYELSALSDLIE